MMRYYFLSIPEMFLLMPGYHKIFNWDAVTDTLCQCHFIGIFQFTAKSDATGNGCDLYRVRLQFFTDIINGGIALYGWAEGKK